MQPTVRDHEPGGTQRALSLAAAFLNRQTPSIIGLLCAAIVLGVGLIDYRTGFEISFAFFYLVPLAIGSWWGGRLVGVALGLLSAMVWFLANYLAGETYSSTLVYFWNTTTRLGFFLVITQLLVLLRRALEQAETQARHDALTGAFNGRAFRELLQVELAKLARHRRPLSLAYIDLDNFKQVNDQQGHSAGDQLLETVVKTCQANLRLQDSIARLGGDEFGLILSETSQSQAQEMIPRLQQRLLAALAAQGWPVTLSIGVVTCDRMPRGSEDLIRQVDELMYRVKKTGKNGIKYAMYQHAVASPQPARESPQVRRRSPA